MNEEETVICIDFGTLFSHAAVVKDGQVNVIYDDDGFYNMASVVYFTSFDKYIVGNRARDISFRNPTNFIYGKIL